MGDLSCSMKHIHIYRCDMPFWCMTCLMVSMNGSRVKDPAGNSWYKQKILENFSLQLISLCTRRPAECTLGCIICVEISHAWTYKEGGLTCKRKVLTRLKLAGIAELMNVTETISYFI